jgi:adenosylmethionine-8-amino-7-oxononanoate aminotransferase
VDAASREEEVDDDCFTHAPAVGLVERLVRLTPQPLQHVFFCDSGSVAVEVAIKMALQSAASRGAGGCSPSTAATTETRSVP